MASLDQVNCKLDGDEELLTDLYDWALPTPLQEKRHIEKIEGTEHSPQTWRMKERMKTVSVALVVCLNVGVDPPGIIKTQPCARLECWIDPLSLSPQKALEQIGTNLQKQYERWQPRARYKTSLDPTVEDVKKLCTSLRRNAKDERVLFHYNGHGVPQPTSNGEVWVFNRNYTQYIPLSIYDLQTWMGSPSIYVYDCSNAGLVIKSFHQFAEQHEKEYDEAISKSSALSSTNPPNFSGCIQLGACGENQLLPMNPDLPADLFTACLTTPIKIALKWFVLHNKDKLVPKLVPDMIDKVPGQLNDRRTMLGELNWVFTAITDTIAWNTLPRHLFQRLFRQDLLVASLFRNFLLAERIMRYYDCTPTSSPKLPPTSQHPMWAAWDLALDLCLSQLPRVLEEIHSNQSSLGNSASSGNTGSGNGTTNGNNNYVETAVVTSYSPSPFFEEQLTAFQVWLEYGCEDREPPEQLPIVLQVLLSQVHRVRALELLGRFLNLGPWAVNLALSVGIFPYVLKLLQSSARELRPLLVFIWAKILAVDHSCQTDLVRDGSHKYFISIVGDTSFPYEHRTMGVFVLSNIVRSFRQGQQAALQSNSIATCLEALDDNDEELRRWICICLGLTWADFSPARWCGVRDSAHEKIYSLLNDPNPEVRAAAVFSLGTFINSTTERTEHANSIDHQVALTLVNKLCSEEGSPLVRQEIVVALHNFILVFENNFVAIEQHHIINQELVSSPVGGGGGMRRISSQTKMKLLNSANPAATVTGAETHASVLDSVRKVASSTSLSALMLAFNTGNSTTTGKSVSMAGIYGKVYNAMIQLEKDPYPGVALLAKTVLQHIRTKARELLTSAAALKSSTSILSGSRTLSPISSSTNSNNTTLSPRPNLNSSISSGISVGSTGSNASDPDGKQQQRDINPIIGTKYIEWCWEKFAHSTIPGPSNGVGFHWTKSATVDTQDPSHHVKEYRYIRNRIARKECFCRHKAFPGKIDEQIFNSKSLQHSYGATPTSSLTSPSFMFSLSSVSPGIVRLHEYDKLLLASEGSFYSLYEYGDVQKLIGKWENSNDSRISSLDWINAHDESLVMVAADDGSIRAWKTEVEKGKPKLITSWNALSEIGQMGKSSKSVGLIARWDQERERVLATGDSKLLRIWDMKTEFKLGDWPIAQDCLVTSIDIHRCEPNLVILGLEEGVVRVIDVRLPQAECGVITWRDFNESWIVSANLRYDKTIVAGSMLGRIRFFDLRSKLPTKTIDTTNDITALAVHPHIPYFSTGCLNHSVNIYGFHGTQVYLTNGIREGLFASGRSGSVTSLHFHPYKPILATADSYSINLYKAKLWTL